LPHVVTAQQEAPLSRTHYGAIFSSGWRSPLESTQATRRIFQRIDRDPVRQLESTPGGAFGLPVWNLNRRQPREQRFRTGVLLSSASVCLDGTGSFSCSSCSSCQNGPACERLIRPVFALAAALGAAQACE